MGALRPKYSFLLNPHADYRASSCPKCLAKTRVRKIPLVIHVEGVGLLILRKTCRPCDLLSHCRYLRGSAVGHGDSSFFCF